jgi:hypothetical protein
VARRDRIACGLWSENDGRAGYNFGIGPLAYTIAREMAVGQNQNKIMSASIVTSYFVTWAFSFTAPYLYYDAGLGPMTCFVYAGTTSLTLLYTWFCVGETAGRTSTEISRFFVERIPSGSGRRMCSTRCTWGLPRRGRLRRRTRMLRLTTSIPRFEMGRVQKAHVATIHLPRLLRTSTDTPRTPSSRRSTVWISPTPRSGSSAITSTAMS